MKSQKIKKSIISMMFLLIMAFSSVARATVSADVSQEYMSLGWSSDETKILAVLHKHEPEIINEKIQLVEYELNTGNTKVLAVYENVTENADLTKIVQNPMLAAKIEECICNGFIQGEKLSEPFAPSSRQTIEIRKKDHGYQVVLRQSGDEISPAELVVLELADWVRSLNARDISEIKIQDVFVSPSRQKALVQIKAIYQKEADIELINRSMFEVRLVR